MIACNDRLCVLNNQAMGRIKGWGSVILLGKIYVAILNKTIKGLAFVASSKIYPLFLYGTSRSIFFFIYYLNLQKGTFIWFKQITLLLIYYQYWQLNSRIHHYLEACHYKSNRQGYLNFSSSNFCSRDHIIFTAKIEGVAYWKAWIPQELLNMHLL